MAALKAVDQINSAGKGEAAQPIVFNTIVDENLSALITGSDGLVLDLFATFLNALENTLGVKRQPRLTKSGARAARAPLRRR